MIVILLSLVAKYNLVPLKAAVRLRHRGSLFRQVSSLLNPSARCLAGDSGSVIRHLDLHVGALRDLTSAALADPGSGSVADKVHTALQVGLTINACAALAPQLTSEFGNKPTNPDQPAAVAARAVELAGSLPESAPPVASAHLAPPRRRSRPPRSR